MAGAVGAAVVLLVVILGALGSRDGNPDSASGLSARAIMGDLPVSIKENGEIEAERRKIIANDLSWPVIILELVDEGTRVEKGQTIVKFECKELIDAIEREDLEVTSAENRHTQARNNLELKEKEMANRVLKAQRAKDDAAEAREVYKLHDYPIEVSEKENAVTINQQDLELAEDKLEFKERVNQMPELEEPFSKNDIRADKLEVLRLTNRVQQAKLELEKLQKFEHARRLRELDESVDDAEIEFKRAELDAKNQLLNAKGDEDTARRTYEMRKNKLDELREDEKKLPVIAEQAGLVVYDTGRRSRWQTSSTVVGVGEKIQPRQQIMVIPDMSSLHIETKVYEAMIEQVYAGIPAFIRLDAKPGVVLNGKVSKVAPLPDSQNRFLNPGVKVYSVMVEFDEIADELKPGMTAEVELVLAELKNVLTVPIAAVFTDQGQTVCYRKSGRHYRRAAVEVGRMNDRRVEIRSGLSVGDEVMLVRPPELQEQRKPSDEPAAKPAQPAMPAQPNKPPQESGPDQITGPPETGEPERAGRPARTDRPRRSPGEGGRAGGRREGGRRGGRQ